MMKRFSYWQGLLLQGGLYAVFLVGYAFLILKFLGRPLAWLFQNRPIVYSILAWLLIVGQGVGLEYVSSLLVERWMLKERK